jgi:hypothetical protein
MQTTMHKSEIENLVALFRADLIAESLKYHGSKAVGAVGSFVAAIESHRTRYAKKFAAIRVNADAATNHLINESERTVDALALQEIQRARDTGCVELNHELSADQQPPQSQGTVELIRESQSNVAPVVKEIVAEETGAEKYVSPDRREQRNDIERIMFLEESQADPVAENLNAAVQSVATMSSEEIDRVISNALEGLRSIMPNNGERVGDYRSRQSELRGSGDEAA